MATAARISVNAKRTSASISDDGVGFLREIRDSLKGLGKAAQKQGSLGMSGLGGALSFARGPGAVLASLLGAGVAGFSGAYGMPFNIGAEKLPNQGTFSSQYADYSKAMIGDEQVLIKTNAMTGDILDILTMQEAKDKEILDEKGNIKEMLNYQGSVFDHITKTLPAYKDAVMFSTDQMAKVADALAKEAAVRGEINSLLLEQRRRLAKSLGSNASFEGMRAGYGPITGDTYAIILEKEQEKQSLLQAYLAGLPSAGMQVYNNMRLPGNE